MLLGVQIFSLANAPATLLLAAADARRCWLCMVHLVPPSPTPTFPHHPASPHIDTPPPLPACSDPIILPFFHSGMGSVMPFKSIRPRLGNEIVVAVGQPLDLSHITCRCNQPGAWTQWWWQLVLPLAGQQRVGHEIRLIVHDAVVTAGLLFSGVGLFSIRQQVCREAPGLVCQPVFTSLCLLPQQVQSSQAVPAQQGGKV